jgi:hypothetical protein
MCPLCKAYRCYSKERRLVLRPSGHVLDGPEYQLLGESYVHGIMNGEAMRNSNVALEEVVPV